VLKIERSLFFAGLVFDYLSLFVQETRLFTKADKLIGKPLKKV